MGTLVISLGDEPMDVADFVLGMDRDPTPDVLLLVGYEQHVRRRKVALPDGYRRRGQPARHLPGAGGKLPGKIEHFGYRDGISQVGQHGLLSREPLPLPQRLVAPDDPQAEHLAQPGQPQVLARPVCRRQPLSAPGAYSQSHPP